MNLVSLQSRMESIKKATRNTVNVKKSMYDCLDLPWNENYWRIKVTHAVAPNEVWAILTENADLLVRAQNRIRKSILKFPKIIEVGQIYLCYLSNGFHRVQIIETHEKCCECSFIDIGKNDTIEYGNIYVCTSEFTKLPPQAIRFELNGFEELQNCPHISHLFNAWLCGKYFQGCITITEADYQMQLRNHGCAKIPIMLYNIHPRCVKPMLLKPMLMQQVGESLPKPGIPFNYTKAKVSHISIDGIIYLQIDRQSIQYIETEIDRTIKQHKHSTNRLVNALNASSNVGLVYDAKQKKYFRARITAEDNGSIKTYRCYFMDLGYTKSIANFDIIQIDKDSILKYYPEQAIPTKLESVVVFDDTVLQRLNSILSPGTTVNVKMANNDNTHPMVLIKKRKMNINKLIYMEIELRDYDMPLPCNSSDDEL